MRGLDELEKQRAKVKPVADLCKSQEFTVWAKESRATLAALKELPWALGSRPAKAHTDLLDSCGLRFPEDTKELYECFLAVKAVVHYTEKRFRDLEAQAERFYVLTEKMTRIMEEERG